MFVRCCRCGDPAGVALTFNYSDRKVWLEDLAGDTAIPPSYALCESHSSRLKPPIGWVLTDQRKLIRPLFVTREVA